MFRLQIEETMELIREEMTLLADVDQPGSQIDRYARVLSSLLQQKADGARINILDLCALPAVQKETSSAVCRSGQAPGAASGL